MTLSSLIRKTVLPIVEVCVPDEYKTEAGVDPAKVYCTFNFFELPEGIGDDCAFFTRAAVQLHLFTPLKTPTTALRRRLWAALAAVEDFSLPTVENASDDIGQHYVFEFDAVGDFAEEADNG